MQKKGVRKVRLSVVFILVVACISGLLALSACIGSYQEESVADHIVFQGESSHWQVKLDYLGENIFYHDNNGSLNNQTREHFALWILYREETTPVEGVIYTLTWHHQRENSGERIRLFSHTWTLLSEGMNLGVYLIGPDDQSTLRISWEGQEESITLQAKP